MSLLIYYRTYISQFFLGYLFNLHSSNVCRLCKKLEPLLAKKTAIKKNRELTLDKILELLVDVTQQRTQGPKNNQDRRKSYSGKKKACTIKTEIVIEKNGKIVSISKSHKGRSHDFRIRKEEKILPPRAIKYGDSGYQGLRKIQSQVVIPYKRYRKKPLTTEQKEHNRALASFPMKVENKFRELKIFKILADVYRNFQKKYHMRFNIIAGLVNLKHRF